MLLPVPRMREIRAIVCMGRLHMARVLRRNAKTLQKRIPAACLQTFSAAVPVRLHMHR